MATVVWTVEALEHLVLVRAYIAQFDPAAAERYSLRLRKAGDSLSDFPSRGRPALGGARELATVPPYVIRYVVLDDMVSILDIRHGRQSG
jgi:toxin ParE1/3/4